MPLITHDKILIIEDDEWYAPGYVEQMAAWLDDDELVGAGHSRYYWPRLARYRELPQLTNAALCRTGFRASLLPTFSACCESAHQSVDERLWAAVAGVKHDATIVVGMKGMPGRKSGGGSPERGTPDADLSVLKSWIGDDVEAYRPVLPKAVDRARAQREKIIVYTVVTGGYDTIRQPLVITPGVRYVAVTDGKAPAPWEIVRPTNPGLTNAHNSRRLKLLSHELFPDADWTIYIDGQLQIACDPLQLLAECEAWGQSDLYVFRHHDRDCLYADSLAVVKVRRDTASNIDPQIARYREAGFPERAGLYLGGMLIRRGHGACDRFNAAWWSEVSAGSHRDQISLPVALASSGVAFTALPALWWTHFFHRQPHMSHNRRTLRRAKRA